MKKSTTSFFILILFSLFFSSSLLFSASDSESGSVKETLPSREYARAKIAEIFSSSDYFAKVIVTSGPHYKKELYAGSSHAAIRLGLNKPGTNVIISYHENGSPEDVLIEGPDRIGFLIILLMISLAIAFFIFGRKICVPLFLGVFNILIILFVFIPAVTSGYSPLSWSLVAALIMILASAGLRAPKSIMRKGLVFASLAGVFSTLLLSSVIFLLNIQEFNFFPAAAFNRVFIIQYLIAVIMLGSAGLIIDFSLRAIKETYKIKLKYPTLSLKGFYEFSSAAAADMLALIAPLLIMAYGGGILAVIFSYNINIYPLSRFMELPNLKFQLYRIFMGGAGFIISVKLGVWAAVKMLKTPPLDKERKKHII